MKLSFYTPQYPKLFFKDLCKFKSYISYFRKSLDLTKIMLDQMLAFPLVQKFKHFLLMKIFLSILMQKNWKLETHLKWLQKHFLETIKLKILLKLWNLEKAFRCL